MSRRIVQKRHIVRGNDIMTDTAALKRCIVQIMRNTDCLLSEAAGMLGISALRAQLWCITDKEYERAVNAVQCSRIIRFLLYCDDLMRSGRVLDEWALFQVEQANEILIELPHAYPKEFGFLADQEDLNVATAARRGTGQRATEADPRVIKCAVRTHTQAGGGVESRTPGPPPHGKPRDRVSSARDGD
jgi:hypothetical protein